MKAALRKGVGETEFKLRLDRGRSLCGLANHRGGLLLIDGPEKWDMLRHEEIDWGVQGFLLLVVILIYYSVYLTFDVVWDS